MLNARMSLLALALCACQQSTSAPVLDLSAAAVYVDAAVPAATPLVTLEGKRVSLAAYRKKVTFIAMWATYCGPCMEEMPMIEALYQKTKGDPDVAIIAVSADKVASAADRARVGEVAKKLGLTLPVLLDVDSELADRYALADGEALPDGGEPSLSLPTAVFLRADNHYTREVGFALGAPADEYLTKHIALLEDAKKGTLPEEPKMEKGSPGAPGLITLPAMSKAAYKKTWKSERAQLKSMLHVSEAQLAVADEQARSGKPIVIHLPAKPATKK